MGEPRVERSVSAPGGLRIDVLRNRPTLRTALRRGAKVVIADGAETEARRALVAQPPDQPNQRQSRQQDRRQPVGRANGKAGRVELRSLSHGFVACQEQPETLPTRFVVLR